MTTRLSERPSEFVSIHDLVHALTIAEKCSVQMIAARLWDLLEESESSPQWLMRTSGVTYRPDKPCDRTGLFALRAICEGRECVGGWDRKMGFSLEALRTFFEARDLKMPPLGAPPDAVVLTKFRIEKKAGGKFRMRTARFFGITVDQVKWAVKRALEAEKAHANGTANAPFGLATTPWNKSSD